MFEKFKSAVNINGNLFNGNNISVQGDTIIIDGQRVKMPEQKNINITVMGNIENLDVGSAQNVEIQGTAGKVSTVSGDVMVRLDVTGGVTTVSGDVSASDINGNVKTTSGDVECDSISGSVTTVSGDIG